MDNITRNMEYIENFGVETVRKRLLGIPMRCEDKV
jgi:hypothetical protein